MGSPERAAGEQPWIGASDAHTTTITVLIVDDHELIRRGLATFLGLLDDLQVVGQAGSGAEAVRLARQLRPDVVLLDLMLPDMDGVAVIRTIKEAVPATQLIALTSFHSDALVLKVLQAGAVGYLLKDIGALGLGEAIRAARAGCPTLAAQATESVVKHSAGRSTPPRGQDLTERDLEVLRLLVRGLTNAQIAQGLARPARPTQSNGS